jgi:2-amino-4-hydroxy-6-hydroxymethyldihydropteridine diphosphokinase
MGIFVGLGSNVGDREMQLRDASSSLRRHDIALRRSASLYITEPRDFEDQPWFLNTVIEIETNLPPQKLIRVCLEIEKEAGRVRDQSRGPRPLDLDIILYRGQILQSDELILPHPRYTERRFVLVPLAEIAPDFRDPVRNLTIQQLLEQCADTGEVRLHRPPLF